MGSVTNPKIEYSDITGWLVKRIGRVLGIYTHEEIFTDISIQNLLTVGLADSNARNTSIRGSGGSLTAYADSYKAFQRDYRKKYSPKFLETLGYAPSSTATTKILVTELVQDYIEADLGITIYSMETIGKVDYLTANEQTRWYMQETYNMSNYTREFVESSKTYVWTTSELVGSTLNIETVWKYDENIIDNLTVNYSYNDINNTITIGLDVYDIGAITNIIYDNGGIPSYKTLCTHIVTEDVIEIYTAVIYNNKSTTDLGIEYLYVEYKVADEIEWYVYIEDADVLPSSLYETVTTAVTAIIPVKENSQVKDLVDYKLKRLLSRLNIEPDELVSSLQNEQIDDAYIMTGISVEETSQPAIKAIYRTFDTASAGSGKVTLSISQLSMVYDFVMDKQTITGYVQEVGTYSKSFSGETMTLIYQGSATEYKKIVISDFAHTYTISGQSMAASLLGGKNVTRIIIPISVLNGLTYREFTDVYERSLCMLSYSMEVVKVKWYESGAFGSILKIVGIVIAVISWGSASSVSAFLWSVATSIAIGVVIKLVLQLLGPRLGFVAVLIGTLIAAYYGLGTTNMSGMAAYLPHANVLLSTMDQSMQIKMNDLLTKGKAELEEIARKAGVLEEQMEGMRSLDESGGALMMGFDDRYNSKSPNSIIDPETYFAMMKGEGAYNGWDILYDVDGAIRDRIITVSG